MRSPDDCRCEPTDDPAEGCLAATFEVPVAEREGDGCE
jgi:hypothetical protein